PGLLARRGRHPALPGWPGVLGLRTDQPVVAVLLHDVRAPPGDPADGEDRGPEVRRDPEKGVRRGRVVVDVHDIHLCRSRGRHFRALLLALGRETLLSLEVLRSLPLLRELLREVAEELGARILGR